MKITLYESASALKFSDYIPLHMLDLNYFRSKGILQLCVPEGSVWSAMCSAAQLRDALTTSHNMFL
jgi:hypothetical protein